MGSGSVQNAGLTPEAIKRLIEGRQQFLSFLEKRIQSKAAAEDILQAAFVRSLEKGGSVRNEESVTAWFYRVLRNAIIDYYRQRGSADRVSEQFVAHLQDHQEPDELFKGEICQCVTALLENLKPEYRDAIQAVDLDDGSMADLATRARITANNAAVRVHRAREALRKQVVNACGICATHGCIECHCKPKSGTDCH
jgi:RNA polymerase sigma-70 factor, ECF subfamily